MKVFIMLVVTATLIKTTKGMPKVNQFYAKQLSDITLAFWSILSAVIQKPV